MTKDTIQIFSRFIRQHGPIFLMQLLAWQKWEDLNTIDSHLFISTISDKDVSVFKVYNKLNELAEQNSAFQVDERTLESISSEQLTELFTAVRQLNMSEINYDFISRIVHNGAYSSAGGEYFLPLEIVEIIIGLAQLKQNDTVVCLDEKAEWLAFKASEKVKKVTLYKKRFDKLPELLNILLETKVKINSGINIPESGRDKYDVYLAAPPFLPNEITETIRQISEQMKKRAVVLVPNSFLFRSGVSDLQFKKEMIYEEIIESVISFPSALLPNTTIPFSILLLNRSKKHREILFVDASGNEFTGHASHDEIGFGRRNKLKKVDEIIEIVSKRVQTSNSVLVTTDECAENEFNLSPERYLLEVRQRDIFSFLDSTFTQPLEYIANLFRPQSASKLYDDNGDDYFEVSVSDIGPDGYIKEFKEEEKIKLDESFKVNFDKLLLKPFDILLPIKGSVGKVGLVPAKFDGRWVANQSLIILRLKNEKESIDPIYLYSYLSSETGRTLIETYATGTAIQFIQMRDLRSFKIPVLPLEKQKEVVEQHRKMQKQFSKIKEIEKEIEKLRGEIDSFFIRSI